MKIPVATSAAIVVILACSAAVVVALREGASPGESALPEEVRAVTEEPELPELNIPVKIIKTEKLEFDLASLSVLVPGEGWLSARDFWEIYYHSPQKLPGDIDFELLGELEALTESERNLAAHGNETQQQPVDMDGDTLDPATHRSTP